ncbi:pickpocket protein 28-like [Sitodiplosis mosellana]|uniref:pickpocket protein 28-like n=1 Tax=Sitodiplosis mosellana TaxID=263140 RepID=UPI002443F8EC|nr:pickpocket protein 28-like [Sitodiplosis mosellana]
MKTEGEAQNKGPKSRVARTVLDFCQNSSFHAISYIGDRKRRFVERTWWFAALIASVSLCIVSIYSIWCKWCENPVIVSMSNKPMSVGEIPFPAVTICPLTKFSTKLFNFTQAYRSIFELDDNHTQPITEEELNLMKIASQICDNTFAGDVLENFTDIYSDHRMLEIIRDLAPSFDDTMFDCKFLGETKCEKLFFPIVTEEGLCYTFNAMSVKEITTDKLSSDFLRIGPNSSSSSNWDMYAGYNDSNGAESYPNRVYGTSVQSGISVILKVLKENIDPLCAGGINGFKVTFHPPQEGPQIWEKFFHISPGKSAIFTINPNVIETSQAVLRYSPDIRQCYYKSERLLRFYRHYTQRNCEVECLANFTLAQCGCIEFSMSRSNETKICGPGKISCCSDASQEVFTSGAFDKCKCLPSCSTISYDAVATQGDYDLSSAWSKSKYQTKFSFDNSTFSRLVIFFKEEMFIPMKRTEFYSLSSFLASSGGLFGLFLGASLLSFIELIYYFSFRIFFPPNEKMGINE